MVQLDPSKNLLDIANKMAQLGRGQYWHERDKNHPRCFADPDLFRFGSRIWEL